MYQQSFEKDNKIYYRIVLETYEDIERLVLAYGQGLFEDAKTDMIRESKP